MHWFMQMLGATSDADNAIRGSWWWVFSFIRAAHNEGKSHLHKPCARQAVLKRCAPQSESKLLNWNDDTFKLCAACIHKCVQSSFAAAQTYTKWCRRRHIYFSVVEHARWKRCALAPKGVKVYGTRHFNKKDCGAEKYVCHPLVCVFLYS